MEELRNGGEKGQSDPAEGVCEAALSPPPSPLNHVRHFPFTRAVSSCVPPLFPHSHRSETTALILLAILDNAEPPVLLLEFLSCRGLRHATSSVPAVFSVT